MRGISISGCGVSDFTHVDAVRVVVVVLVEDFSLGTCWAFMWFNKWWRWTATTRNFKYGWGMLGISLHLAMPIMWKRWDLIRIDSNDRPFYRNFGDDAQGKKVWHCQAIPSPNCYTPWVKAGRPQCPYRGLDMSVVCCLTKCWNPILFWGLDTIPNRKESLGHLQKRWSIMEPQEDPYNDGITISNIPFNIDSNKST